MVRLQFGRAGDSDRYKVLHFSGQRLALACERSTGDASATIGANAAQDEKGQLPDPWQGAKL
jgi:hypothetical protein